jgi:hypothetical protein
MKIDVTQDALLRALVEAIRDERDHGGALMRLMLRLVNEAGKRDWFETHWRTEARLNLAQLACGDIPTEWRSAAPALDVIAEAARWALKTDQLGSEGRAALLAITRLVDVERAAHTSGEPEMRSVAKPARRRKAKSSGRTRRAAKAAVAAKSTPATKGAKARPAAKSASARKSNGAVSMRKTRSMKSAKPAVSAKTAKAKPTRAKPATKVTKARPAAKRASARKAKVAKTKPAAKVAKAKPAAKVARSQPVAKPTQVAQTNGAAPANQTLPTPASTI